MPFLQLTFECAAPDSQALEDACLACGALAVTLTDAADTPILEPALNTTPLWPQVRVALLFAESEDREVILHELATALPGLPGQHTFEHIADRAWEREWLVDFKPMRFGERLWICPHEQEVDAPQAVVVRLDPGLAFGTGTHATTALCLQWLDSAELRGKTVIDYGCGSGILAIAALKLGAGQAWAVDHDPQALLATRENAARNAVSDSIHTSAPDAELPRAQVLLANILALPLIELAPLFQDLVLAGGQLVLSGILAEQADSVAAAHARGFRFNPPAVRDGWVRLHGERI